VTPGGQPLVETIQPRDFFKEDVPALVSHAFP